MKRLLLVVTRADDWLQSHCPGCQAIFDRIGSLDKCRREGPGSAYRSSQPTKPRLSDLVDMEIEVTSQPDVEVKPPTFGDAVGDFLVREYREPTADTSTKNEPHLRRFHYRLEPVSSGKHLIRSVAIEFIDHREASESKGKASFVESDPIEIEITSEFGEQTPDLQKLDPMHPPVLTDSPWNWWWLAIALPLIASAIAWIVYRRRMKSSEPAIYQPTPKRSPGWR